MTTSIWSNLLALLFPNLCLLCKEPLVQGEAQICLRCLADLPRTGYHRAEQQNPAEQLFAGNPQVHQAYSFLYYTKGGGVQKLIHALKYHENRELGYLLGRLAAQELLHAGSALCGVDLLVPIPLHPKRLRERGYNQAEWIAKGLNAVWKTPINTTAVCRTQGNDTQTRKNVYDRWINTQNVFSITNPAELEGKNILLVDDVITTGSTISGCVSVLSTIPDVQIKLFSLGIA